MAPNGKWIEGIGPDSSVEEAAHRSLGARLAAVNQWLPRAAYLSDQDVEHVHRLRVSTRRAVAAIDLYRDWLPRKRAGRLQKRLKKIRRTAGEARDLDVLGQRLALDYGEQRVAPVVAMIAERRAAVQPALVKVAERFRCRDRLTRKTVKLLNGIRPPDRSLPPARFGDWAADRLAKAAGDFFAANPGESGDMAALHQFRIRGKVLRYTVELVAPAFGPELRDEYYRIVEELQERLGSVQDHVTAGNCLLKWASESKEAALQNVLRELAAEEGTRLKESASEFHGWWTAERADALRRGLIPQTANEPTTPLPPAAGQT